MFSTDDFSSLRVNQSTGLVEVIDQTLLPHALRWVVLDSLEAYCHAISAMQVRGAPLIGITAAFGMAQALAEDASDQSLEAALTKLLATRPTAVNLSWALEKVSTSVRPLAEANRAESAWQIATQLRAENIASCEHIGENGLEIFRSLWKQETLNVMTHCNAGWLATVQWGTALAPVYKAHACGLPVHVWVSETRPRNQGTNLTAWELQRAGVPFTLVADNSCGQLMREQRVDCVVVGSDRTAANGDVCNKVGTYLKALAAQANDVPFYVALPHSTIDWRCDTGDRIPIEERDQSELLSISGCDAGGALQQLALAGEKVTALNPAFDVTPADLVTALITDLGSFETTADGMQQMYRAASAITV